VDLGALAGDFRLTPVRALLERKRWQWAMVATPEVLLVLAVVDLGYSANAFLSAVDVQSGRPLFDGGWLQLPGPAAGVGDAPGEGLSAHLRQPGLSLKCERPAGQARYRLTARISRLQAFLQGARQGPVVLDAELLAAGGAPPLTVVAPLGEAGKVNVTQKWGGLLAFGTLTAGGRRFLLDGGVGGLDYTQGLHARHTAWRWAFASGRLPDGTPFGLNAVEGFNESPEANENALWVGEALEPLARARISFMPRDVMAPWRVTTADGAVDLTFRPLHPHREERDLKLVRAHFLQALGTFEGRVRVKGRDVRVSGVPGVTEDQDVLW
jgi:hypothetical protein